MQRTAHYNTVYTRRGMRRLSRSLARLGKSSGLLARKYAPRPRELIMARCALRPASNNLSTRTWMRKRGRVAKYPRVRDDLIYGMLIGDCVSRTILSAPTPRFASSRWHNNARPFPLTARLTAHLFRASSVIYNALRHPRYDDPAHTRAFNLTLRPFLNLPSTCSPPNATRCRANRSSSAVRIQE